MRATPSGQREASTRARLVQELLDTPAVQELVRAHLEDAPDRMGALEAAVRADPVLAMGVATTAVQRLNDTARTLRALTELLAGMPAPLVQEVLKDSWRKLDGDAIGQACSSIGDLLAGDMVDWRAVTAWTSDRLERASARLVNPEGLESKVMRQSVRVVLESFNRALQREPRLVAKVVDDALDAVDPDVVKRTLDSTLEQVTDVLAARPYMLRSLGRFALRLARGSVRATLRR